MKPSNYNFFFPYEPDDSKLIAYNSFSNALALMEKEKHKIFTRFCENGENMNDDEFEGQLKAGHFLIEDDCNELDILRFRMLSARYNTDFLGLTIAPTADCNFRCAYCYEKDVIKPDYMSEEVQDKIIELVKSRAKVISHLSVTWYGGEPLMAVDVIERLSRKFIEICNENKITYSGNIVTNGYLLTKEIAKLLQELIINTMQITMDGGRETHDSRRPHADGSGTFDAILSNMAEAKEFLPTIGLRVNVDKENISSAKEISDILSEKGLSNKVSIYLGKIMDENDTYDGKKCFDMYEFSHEEFKHYLDVGADVMWRYPRSVSNVCGADSCSSHIIAADGRMYKCWADIGNHERCTGKLVDRITHKDNVFLSYMLFDPTTSNPCKNCNVLPVCMGGCPYKRLNEDTDKCGIHKFVLEKYLRIIARKLKLSKDLRTTEDET